MPAGPAGPAAGGQQASRPTPAGPHQVCRGLSILIPALWHCARLFFGCEKNKIKSAKLKMMNVAKVN